MCCKSLKMKKNISKIKNTIDTIFQVVEFCRNNCCIKNSICSNFYRTEQFASHFSCQYIFCSRNSVLLFSIYDTVSIHIYSKLNNFRFTSWNSPLTLPGTVSHINSNNSVGTWSVEKSLVRIHCDFSKFENT